MGKHEIRLRRQRLTARGADRFRNYDTILKRHEQDQRVKKIVRIFAFFAIVLILILLLVIVSRWEKKNVKKSGSAITYILNEGNCNV